jgi:hypothetical protein
MGDVFPVNTWTTQLPQVPSPPQILTRSTPRKRAHSNKESSFRHSPRRPTGSKSIKGVIFDHQDRKTYHILPKGLASNALFTIVFHQP